MITIWIGVCITALLNLWWGFALSGLIVPGFLVPLTMAYPITGCLIVIEAVIAWGIVATFCRLAPSLGFGSKLFGRDRFFAILLASIFARLLIEAVIFPYLISHMDAQNQLQAKQQATSFGLILVPLLANQFWKPGLKRGLIASGLANMLTYLIISLILIPLTNFNFQSMQVHFDLASQYLPDTPKTYIILMTTVFIASRFNLKYGWDFSGIIFPGLIALSLADPYHLLMTLCETLFLVVFAKICFLLPSFKAKAQSGAYSIIFFFNLALVYRFLILPHFASYLPSTATDDLLGLGYIMSVMFAIKINRQAGYGLHLAPSLSQVAVIGGLVGLMVSTFLAMITRTEVPKSIDHNRSLESSALAASIQDSEHPISSNRHRITPQTHKDLVTYLHNQYDQDRLGLIDGRTQRQLSGNIANSLKLLRRDVIEPLVALRYSTLNNPKSVATHKPIGPSALDKLSQIHTQALSLGYRLDLIQTTENHNPIVVVHPKASAEPDHKPDGLFAIRMEPSDPIGLIVSHPFIEYRSFEFGVWGFDHWNTAYLIAGFNRSTLTSSLQVSHDNFLSMTLNSIAAQAGGDRSQFIEITSDWQPSDTYQPNKPIRVSQALLDNSKKIASNLRHTFSQFGLKLAFNNHHLPSYHLYKKAQVAGISLYSMSVPKWALERLNPIEGISTWQSHFQLINRKPLVYRSITEVSEQPYRNESTKTDVNQAIDQYMTHLDPFILLATERNHPGIRYDLITETQSGQQYLLVHNGEGRAYQTIKLTGFADQKATYQEAAHFPQSQIMGL